ncbi:DUF3017 domain-containing protein [Luteimicrobium sp. NPDC057192]|uniref:DUF3017 domain-containing protein n=1 Tax=Luteimicrobium sp. NPDC057192 TaxID=3346042 RepID=UPI003640135E
MSEHRPPTDEIVVPRRTSAAVWLVVAAVVAATVTFAVVGPRAGCSVVSGTLFALAVARAVGPEPGLPGIAVRGRALDVVGYTLLGAVIAVLAFTSPSLVA